MQYGEIVIGSFRIPWRHRYLWLLALFAGEGGGGASFNYSTGTSGQGFGNSGAPNPGEVAHQVSGWLQDHIGLVVALLVIWLVIVVALFVLGAVCEAAVIRAAAEHDAQRPFGLGPAWRAGIGRMGSMIRFRLLLLALGLPAVILIGGLVAGLVAAAVNNQAALAVLLGILVFVFGIAAVVYAVYLNFLNRLGTRALILEPLQARASIARAHRLLRKRLGRTLVAWLISIGVGIATGLGLAVGLLVVAIPAIGFAIAAAASGSAILWGVFAICVLAVLVVRWSPAASSPRRGRPTGRSRFGASTWTHFRRWREG
jgi:hypothetical protein